ncbi:MAG TPA: flagellar assembly protein FliH [Burkholderiaceae bacterium]|nr:flagellar assembly protein FliH [Burkholderiaceae bacterium]
MGASDPKQFRGFIPKERLGETVSWELQPLAGDAAPRSSTAQGTERERRAFERGRALGRTEGAAAERQRKLEVAAQLERVFAELRARFAELESAGADALLDCAIAIARQVVRREIATRRDALLPAAREAVALVVESQTHPRVHVNPQDYETLRADLEADGLFKGCRFVADPQIERGGCRVETALGEVDATVQTRWQRVLAALGVEDRSITE